MGLVYVVGFCTTDFPDGTTGSVPACWAWAALREPARTSDPTNANRTDGNFFRSNFFMRLSPCTQLTVTRRRYGRTLSLSRTKWRFGGPADESCQAERVTLHAPGQHPAVAAVKRGQRRVAILSQDHHAPDLPAAHRPLPAISAGTNIAGPPRCRLLATYSAAKACMAAWLSMYRSTRYTRPSSVSVVDVSVERGLRHRAQPASAVRALQPQEKRPDLALSRGVSSSRTRPSLDLAFVARAICTACVVARGLNCDQLFRFAESTYRFSTF